MYRTRRDDQHSIGRPVFWICVLFVVAMVVAGAGLGLLGSKHLDATVRREAREHSLSWLRRHTLVEARHVARNTSERLRLVESTAEAIADVVARQGPAPPAAPDRIVESVVIEERDAVLPALTVPGVTAAARASTTDERSIATLAHRADELAEFVHALTHDSSAVRRITIWVRDEGVILADGSNVGADGDARLTAPELEHSLPLDLGDARSGRMKGWNVEHTDGGAAPTITYETAVWSDGTHGWHADSELLAWVRVDFDLGAIGVMFDQSDGVRPHAATLLIDHDRTPLYVTDDALRALGVTVDATDRDVALRETVGRLTGSDGFLVPGDQGMVRVTDTTVGAVAGVAGTGWCAVSVLPRYTELDAAFDASAASRDVSHRIGAGLLAFTFLFGSIAIFAAVRFSAWLRDRLSPLLDSARAMARGDFSKHVPTRGQDEISAVAVALNTSRVRLRSTLARLEESQRRIAVLIQSMTEGFVITDGEDRISFANDCFAAMLKRPIEEVIGKQVGDLVTQDSLETYRRQAALRYAGEDGRYDLSWLVKGGGNCRTLVSAMPLMDEEGRVIGSCGVVTDVTKRTRAQRETARAEKLRALGEMAGGVAHDFNNILSAILGNAQYLLMEPLSDDSRAAMEVIERAALDGTETVRRIREFTRPRSGLHEADPVDANSIVEDVVALVRKRVDDIQDERGVAITVTTRTNSRRAVFGNAAELREVLLNLVLNALDAMPVGGLLTVEAFDRGEDSIGLRVTDTGTGIDSDVRDKIFDPFFSTKPGGPSSGLGLSICYGIVRSHDGRIDVRTSSDGTTFTVVLPSFESRTATHCETTRAGHLPPPPKVLHVSPLGERAERLRRRLEDRRVEVAGVETFGEAAKALATSNATELNVLVTELALGRDSGWQLSRLARRSRPTLRILLLADPGHGIDETQARNAGIDRVLTRPFDVEDVHSAVLSALTDAPVTSVEDGTTTAVFDERLGTVGIYSEGDDLGDGSQTQEVPRDDERVPAGVGDRSPGLVAATALPGASPLPNTIAAAAEQRTRRAPRRRRDDNVYIDEHTVAALDFILKRSARSTDRGRGKQP